MIRNTGTTGHRHRQRVLLLSSLPFTYFPAINQLLLTINASAKEDEGNFMSQLIQTEIVIEGRNIGSFSSLSLSQSIFEHHTFRLVCPTEAIDGTSGTVFHTSGSLVGTAITIQSNAVGGPGRLCFKGVVTQIETARYSGHMGDLIISGYSPTVLMDNGPHCTSWEAKTINDIAQDVLQHFPQNQLQPQIAPTNRETLPYTVQYKETAWQFLSRLSSTYGEWFFYDGEKLVLRRPQGSEARLLYGSNLNQFNMILQVRPSNFQMMAYDYTHHRVYTASPQDINNRAGLNNLGQFALQRSEQFYGTTSRQWHNDALTNQQQLDAFVNTRAAMQSSSMVRFMGNSGHPGIKVGDSVNVQGRNVFTHADETFGNYTILSVQHHCDGQGNYTNDFTAIPSSIHVPPVIDYINPHCETQSALVTDNHDPDGLGRIRVRFHWMSDREKSPWLRVTTPQAGGGRGMFFIPEVGEEVIVGFQGDSPTQPYIIGAVFHGQANTNFGNGGNDVKTIQSRSGSRVVMNDSDGSMHVADSNGNNMHMDGNGNLTIEASASIKLQCGDHLIELKSDGTINANGNNITITGTDITTSGTNVTMSGTQNAAISSGSASFAANGRNNEATMSGTKANVNGTIEANVNASAKTTISATGKVSLQGAIVALN